MTTDQRVQQVVLPEGVARKIFPADSKWLLPNDPPSITWLAGPIECEWCVGEGWLYGDPDHYERGTEATMVCEGDDGEPTCLGLGYPPIVEVVSERLVWTRGQPLTVHGRLALGTPVPVHGEDDQSWDWVPSIEIGDEGAWYYYDQAYCDDPSIETKPSDISDTVAGTLVPGGVACPVTVAT